MAYDDRQNRKRLWAAVNSSYWGSYLSSSEDFGKTWTEPETYGVKFPEGTEASLKQIWQIAPAPESRTVLAYLRLVQIIPTGASWALVEGLYNISAPGAICQICFNEASVPSGNFTP